MADDVLRHIVKSVIGKSDTDVISVLTRAAERGYDKRKLKERLSDHVSDSVKLSKLVDRYFSEVQSTSHVATYPSAQGEQHKRTHKLDTGNTNGDVKRPRLDPVEVTKPDVSDPKVVNGEKVQDVLLEAKRAIEERKRQMKFPAAVIMPPAGSIVPGEAQALVHEALMKQQKVDELRARIAARIGTMMNYQSYGKQEGKPAPLILDAEGRTVDRTGREVQLTHRTPTLKANIRAERREQFKKSVETAEKEESNELPAFFDARVGGRTALRKKRMFKFHEKGTFEKQANRMRAKAKLEKLQHEISQAAKKTGISSAVKLAVVASKPADTGDLYIPSIEWWDQIVLSSDNYKVDVNNIDFAVVTNLVEHPVQLKAPGETTDQQYLKVYLTTKEQKKLRRQNRKEMQREKTEKIRLGLEPPPEPKVKISNLMRVLGSQAVLDPTKMEAHVREQMAKRLKKHEEDNASRKLTPEQRTAKKVKKLQEDTSQGVHVAVYRVVDLSSPGKKFKVEMNAKQLYMTGVVVLHKDMNVIVVEGGPKQQKFFKNLMMKRIRWSEETSKEAAKREDKTPNKCVLIWEGLVKERNFGEIRFKACPLEKQARELFQKRGVEHYWDIAFSGAILEQAEDPL